MTEAVKEYLGGGITSALGFLVFCFGFVRMRKYQIIRDVPQSKIRSMAIGLVEVSGDVVAQEHLTAPLSHTDCVYYRYTIEEYRERSGSDGKTESEIVKIADEDKRVPFFVRDDTGQVIIDPGKADIVLSPKKIFSRSAKPQGVVAGVVSALQQVKGVVHAVQEGKSVDQALPTDVSIEGLAPVTIKYFVWHNSRHGDRKYTEYYIEPNELLYVLGSAANHGVETSELMIHKGENEPTFIISDKSEKGLLRRLLLEMWLCFVLGGLFFVIGAYILSKTLNLF